MPVDDELNGMGFKAGFNLVMKGIPVAAQAFFPGLLGQDKTLRIQGAFFKVGELDDSIVALLVAVAVKVYYKTAYGGMEVVGLGALEDHIGIGVAFIEEPAVALLPCALVKDLVAKHLRHDVAGNMA
jgi:hypothetical protein